MWGYTPFQAEAFVRLHDKRQRQERARLLEINFMAFRSEDKTVNRRINKDWDG